VNRHSRSSALATAVTVILATLGLLSEPAAAGSESPAPARRLVRTHDGGVIRAGNTLTVQPRGRVVVPPGNVVIGAPQPPSHNFGPSYPFGYNYKGQSAVLYGSPAHVAPRFIPGHWGRRWVPQYYAYEVWVPGSYADDGGWVDGYYESRTAQSGGYYQQVWEDGYWAR